MSGLGAGMRGKALNNSVWTASLTAVRQAFDWAAAPEVDREKLRALMHDGSGKTRVGSRLARIAFAPLDCETGVSLGILERDARAALTPQPAPARQPTRLRRLRSPDRLRPIGWRGGACRAPLMPHLPVQPQKPGAQIPCPRPCLQPSRPSASRRFSAS
ncbi:MAG: hypothetical protein AAFR16_12110 [Pseudomonadota bacterium]